MNMWCQKIDSQRSTNFILFIQIKLNSLSNLDFSKKFIISARDGNPRALNSQHTPLSLFSRSSTITAVSLAHPDKWVGLFLRLWKTVMHKTAVPRRTPANFCVIV